LVDKSKQRTKTMILKSTSCEKRNYIMNKFTMLHVFIYSMSKVMFLRINSRACL
jgi:hypothetical protein